MFRDLERAAALNLARTIKVIEAHICARLYDEKYKAEKWQKTLEQIQAIAQLGVVFLGQFFDKMCDDAIGIDNLDRTNGIHGAGIDKDRIVVILKRLAKEALVLAGYAFGDYEEPPPELRAEHAHLKPRNDDSNPEEARGLPVIRFWGLDELKKITYLRWTRPVWIPLRRTPFAKLGELVAEDYPTLADLVGLEANHPFRVEGQRLKQVQDELVAGIGRQLARPQMATRAQEAVDAASEEDDAFLEEIDEDEVGQEGVEQGRKEDQNGESEDMPGDMTPNLGIWNEDDGDFIWKKRGTRQV